MCVSVIIAGLQKPGLRYTHTMTSLCQQHGELEINELPWNLLQHHSNGRGDGLKKRFGAVQQNPSKVEICLWERHMTAEGSTSTESECGTMHPPPLFKSWCSTFTGNWCNTCWLHKHCQQDLVQQTNMWIKGKVVQISKCRNKHQGV